MRLKYYLLSLLVLTCLSGSAANYYISSNGNDLNDGSSPFKAWKSLNKINSLDLNPGDRILLEGGQVFTGIIYLSQEDSGTASNPVVITSYGTGRSNLNAGNGFGIYASNVAGISIHDLNIYGTQNTNTGSGIDFYCDLITARKLTFVEIYNVTIKNFGSNGIEFGSGSAFYSGYYDVKISKCILNKNYNGIFMYDRADTGITLLAHHNLHIYNCIADSNQSTGILISGVEKGLIDYCRASYTGYNGKTEVAIWAYSTKNVIFDHCIASHSSGTGPDGGGFDLDGGTENCIVQYCYSYMNSGPGYMHCDYPNSRPTRNNNIRYCISENDGRKAGDGRCSYLHISWGSGLENCHIYNNAAYITDNKTYTVSGYKAFIWKGYSGNIHLPFIKNCKIDNNIFYVIGKNHHFIDTDGSGDVFTDANFKLNGNCFYSDNSSSKNFEYNGIVYTTLNDFQDQTSQEMSGSDRTGFSVNPKLFDPGNAGNISDPFLLSSIKNYNITSASAIIGKSSNSDTLTRYYPPVLDYNNDSLKIGRKFTAGIDEPVYPKAGFKSENVCFGDTAFIVNTASDYSSVKWLYSDSTASQTIKGTHFFNKPGKYDVIQIVSNFAGFSDTAKSTLTVYNKSTANFIVTDSCLGHFTGFNFNGNNADTYYWKAGNLSSVQKDFYFKYSDTGLVKIKLKVISADGCKDSIIKNIKVIQHSKPSFNIEGFCFGDSTGFIANQIKNYSYSWQFGDGNTGNGATVKHRYNNQIDYPVRLISSTFGCKDTSDIQLSIKALLNAEFTFDHLCLGDTVSFLANGAKQQYSWSFGDGFTDTFQAVNHSFAASGIYNVKLETSLNGCKNSLTKTLNIHDLPDAAFDKFSSGSEVTFVAFDSTLNNYKWKFDSEQPVSGNHIIKKKFFSKGTHDVVLKVTDKNGCISSQSDKVEIEYLQISRIESRSVFTLFPNPASGSFTIHSDNHYKRPLKLNIFDVSGASQMVVEFTFELNGNYHINIPELAAGSYLVSIESDNEIERLILVVR